MQLNVSHEMASMCPVKMPGVNFNRISIAKTVNKAAFQFDVQKSKNTTSGETNTVGWLFQVKWSNPMGTSLL